MLCRAISKDHVNILKKNIRGQSLPVATILPVATDQSIDEFSEETIGRMPLYTLGGNHLRRACKELLDEGEKGFVE